METAAFPARNTFQSGVKPPHSRLRPAVTQFDACERGELKPSRLPEDWKVALN